MSNVLKLSGYGTSRTPGNYSGQYGSRYASNYSSRLASRSRPAGWRDQYGLEELQSTDTRHSDEIRLKGEVANYSATAAYYNGSGSEENHPRIEGGTVGDDRMRQRNGDGKGNIMLTTEVIVQ